MIEMYELENYRAFKERLEGALKTNDIGFEEMRLKIELDDLKDMEQDILQKDPGEKLRIDSLKDKLVKTIDELKKLNNSRMSKKSQKLIELENRLKLLIII